MLGDIEESHDARQRPAVGTIILRDGSTVDATLAAEMDLCNESSNEEDDEEEKTPSPPEVEPPAAESTVAAATTPTRLTQAKQRSTPSDNQPASRVVGRPKRAKQGHRPTVTSPSREPLQRDPSRAAADALEKKANKKLAEASARLGGQDLRVVRDNLPQLSKRSPSEASGQPAETSYAKNKRIRTARKLSELDKAMSSLEEHQTAGRSDMMELLLLLREESERKEAAAEKRRQEERQERADSEKRDREHRDQIRWDEAEALETRRLRELEAARQEREERYRQEQAAQQARSDQRERELEESRRRFEQRLELDRQEAQNRHEQMMMLFSSMQKK